MNGIFLVVFILCSLYFLVFSPENFLPTLLGGTQKAATLTLSLVAVYSVWMGFAAVMEKSGLNEKVSRILQPVIKKLFHTQDERTLTYLSLNLSANMLGISGAATPFGIEAAQRLDDTPFARYNQNMLFVLNATGVQILPTTVLALFISYDAADAYSLILPSLLASAISTVTGVIAVKLFIRKDG